MTHAESAGNWAFGPWGEAPAEHLRAMKLRWMKGDPRQRKIEHLERLAALRHLGEPFGGGGPMWGRGGPFGGGRGRGRRRRGDVRTALLLLLAEEARNGYQLMQTIEERSGGRWRPSPGSVYPALAQLEDEGLVRTDVDDDHRAYVLTDAGRAVVESRGSDLGAPWEQMTGAVDDGVGALFRELRRVGLAVGQIGHLGDDAHVARARDILADARRALYSLLAEDESND
jgi:DNA-binding PadR family transcriptional regulator